MRFAWLRKTEFPDRVFTSSTIDKTIFPLYNIVWWIPVVLPFLKVISYQAGFIAFFLVTVARAILNAYRVNVLSPEKAVMFPFRMP